MGESSFHSNRSKTKNEKMVGKTEFAGIAGKWKQTECTGREDFMAKNPGTPASNDITIEYVLADNDFVCNVSVDEKPAACIKFAYTGDMENQIGEEKYLTTTGFEADCMKIEYKCMDGTIQKTQKIKCGGDCDKIVIEDEGNGAKMTTS